MSFGSTLPPSACCRNSWHNYFDWLVFTEIVNQLNALSSLDEEHDDCLKQANKPAAKSTSSSEGLQAFFLSLSCSASVLSFVSCNVLSPHLFCFCLNYFLVSADMLFGNCMHVLFHLLPVVQQYISSAFLPVLKLGTTRDAECCMWDSVLHMCKGLNSDYY